MSTNKSSASAADAVAIIGMSGRFPGAASIDALWDNLKNGVESIANFSDRELKAAGVDLSYVNAPGFVARGCVLEAIDQFDASFFGYSARDAETIDPQQRIFMECAWECLEQAGYDPETYPGMIGVFAGSDQSSYLYQIYSSIDLSAFGYGGMMAIGNEKDYVATQVSYKMNLRGPSLNVQTSCSTSLVTVCVALQNLVHGYCDMALAGGVAISVPQKKGYWYQAGGIVSPDGHCRPFDASGQGTVVGNGVGVVLLKRLADALADGDRIEAVIKGFALNNDGAVKVGYTAPSIDGQAQVIAAAQRMAGVSADSVGYIEAHGTATALGDPIEVAALTKAFRESTSRRQFCAIGSLKSNVGHLSSAAGIAGLIKGVLVVKHGQIPKSLHYEQPNPQIDFAGSPFFVAADLIDWPIKNGARRAGVSSFGVGGTNAHLVLEEPPAPPAASPAPRQQLIVLSARTATALDTLTDNLASHVAKHPELDPADVAFTTQAGRKAFSHRRFLTFDREDPQALVAALRSRDPQSVVTGHTDVRERAVVFMFSGQGTQYVDMGRGLYDADPGFRADVDTCCEILKGEMGLDLRSIMHADGDREAAAAQLRQTAITQPALFTIEYALARWWMRCGLTPNAMLGHSIGEYVAACLAGVMSLEDALAVVAMRGRLMGSMPGGSMLAVPLSEGALQPLLGPYVSLAAVNAPSMCVLAGPAPILATIERDLVAQNIPCSRLHTSHAFHSSMMDPVLVQFTERLRRVKLAAPKLAYLSNVTGSWITPELAMSPDYWAAHLRHTVRFADNLREVMTFPDLALLEIGPGHTLGMLARQQGSRASSQLIVSSLRTVQETVDDNAFLLAALGRLWAGGVQIDWRAMHRHERRHTVALPTYPFERQRYWLGPLETIEADQPQVAQAAQPMAPVTIDGTRVILPEPTAALDIDGWFAVPTWKPAVAAAKSRGKPNGKAGTASWLVFADAGGLGEGIAEALRARGEQVAVAGTAATFSAGDGHYRLRPTERADYEALLADLGDAPGHILHLWSIDPAPAGASPTAAFDAVQDRSYVSLILLAQALVKRGGSSPVQIGIVTDRLQPVLGDEPLRAAAATVAGACKVIPQEYPHLRCRLIDVVADQPGLAGQLAGELTEPFEPVVAWRNGRRWVQSFEPVQLEAPAQAPALLEDGGVYLLTGGTGNIGLILAEAIARDVKAKLVLTGRSALPPRERWDAHLKTNGRDKASAVIERVRAIERLGSEVLLVATDITDRDAVAALVGTVMDKWGTISGVIHGAANLSPDAFGPIGRIDRSHADAHFRPKDHGLLLLEEALAGRPPKFWLLMSSISAALGGLGLASYAAANAFLDAEAQRLDAQGTAAAISVNWDAWDFAPAAKNGAITAAAGQDAFRRIMAAGLRQVVVSATPLEPRLDQWVRLKTIAQPASQPAASRAAATAERNGGGHARPELSTAYVAPRSQEERSVAEVWEHFLGVAPIGINDKFFELGGHSLLAIQVLARLREIFDMDIPVQRLFEAPTVALLTESITRDRTTAPAAAAAAGDEDLAEMLSFVEGLSDAEVDAWLNEAEAPGQSGGRHA
jgi:phthiocerol/phenolphthiocerol synthesis type-I polyketide synthase E